MTTVRIATERLARGGSPSLPGAMSPIAPQYTPRGVSSRRVISSIVESFGAPVIEPQGNIAPSTPARPVPGRGRERRRETSWNRVGYSSTPSSSVTSTLPGSLIRAMSLRSRSTIMTFSARSFSPAASISRAASSVAGWPVRGAVPFIGAAVISFPSQVRKVSGLAETTVWRPSSR